MLKFNKLQPRFDTSSDAASAIANGQAAINSYDPKQAAGSVRQGSNDLFNSQMGQNQNYVGQYSQAVANNPSVTSLYKTANDMFNVPGLANTSTYLNNQVTNALPDAYRGARGFDIGATAINNGVASKLAYLTPQANAATANYNTASGLASNFVQAGQTQNAQNLLPIQAMQPLLQNAQSTQGTIWNTASESELQGLLQKMQSGVALSQTEIQRAQALAVAQEQAVAAQNVAKIGQQYQVLSPAQKLVNTMTGKVTR